MSDLFAKRSPQRSRMTETTKALRTEPEPMPGNAAPQTNLEDWSIPPEPKPMPKHTTAR
mgnify:CR=1 FL=1